MTNRITWAEIHAKLESLTQEILLDLNRLVQNEEQFFRDEKLDGYKRRIESLAKETLHTPYEKFYLEAKNYFEGLNELNRRGRDVYEINLRRQNRRERPDDFVDTAGKAIVGLTLIAVIGTGFLSAMSRIRTWTRLN